MPFFISGNRYCLKVYFVLFLWLSRSQEYVEGIVSPCGHLVPQLLLLRFLFSLLFASNTIHHLR